jgi:hypothetical protein
MNDFETVRDAMQEGPQEMYNNAEAALDRIEAELNLHKGYHVSRVLGDDVETILRAITAAGDPYGEDAFPALRRIEAEVERLRAENEMRGADAVDLHREVERLREDGLAVERALDKANGEITRLRVQNADYAAGNQWYHKEVERLRALVIRAASIFDDHIDNPQAVSHAELRATAKEFRAALAKEEK